MQSFPWRAAQNASMVSGVEHVDAEHAETAPSGGDAARAALDKIDAISRSNAMIEFKPDGTIVHANENFLAAMGYTLAEVQGRHHRMFVEPEEASSPAYEDFWEELRQGRAAVAEFRRLAKHGREIWIQATYAPLRDVNGHIYGVLKIAADITEEKRAAAENAARLADVQSTAAATAEQADMAATASTQVAANVDSVAVGGEELSASVREIARQVAQAGDVSQAAVERAEHANQIIASLSAAAEQIGAVVGMISDIADQTNLLALNATIEAARAGEVGRGFAVVAGEVKALANQSNKATDRISEQINGVQAATTEAVEAISAIKTVIADINEISVSVASAVEEQAAVAEDIASNMQEASRSVSAINDNLAHIAAASVQVRDSADRVRAAAQAKA